MKRAMWYKIDDDLRHRVRAGADGLLLYLFQASGDVRVIYIMEHLEKDNDMNDLQTEATQDRRRIAILRLRELQQFWESQTGSNLPGWLHGEPDWDSLLGQLMGEAADLIVDLTVEVDSLQCMLENAMSGNDM